jgi:hypothetical protein
VIARVHERYAWPLYHQLFGGREMTAQPARIDLADVGPGVAWAFEFDENGRGRLLGGDSSFDLMHGAPVRLDASDPRQRPHARLARPAGGRCARGARGPAVPGPSPEDRMARRRLMGRALRSAPRGGWFDRRGSDRHPLRSEAAVPRHRAPSSGQFRARRARSDRGGRGNGSIRFMRTFTSRRTAPGYCRRKWPPSSSPPPTAIFSC